MKNDWNLFDTFPNAFIIYFTRKHQETEQVPNDFTIKLKPIFIKRNLLEYRDKFGQVCRYLDDISL